MPVFFDLVFVALIAWFFISQLIIPTIQNQPILPRFRGAKKEQLAADIKRVEEELEAANLEQKLKVKKEQLKTKR